MLISRGNLKLGMLPSFSLPVFITCPGQTPFCEQYCFGLKGNFILDNVRDANERRLDASLRNDFVPIIVREISQTHAPAFRIHVIGDFYSVEYIKKWISIADLLPDVIFFGSTRSWRCRPLAEEMKYFRDIQNVFVKASTDFTDPQDPVLCGWHVWSVEGEGMACLHDEGRVKNCFQCRYCWTKKDIDVKFKLRWGKVKNYMANQASLL